MSTTTSAAKKPRPPSHLRPSTKKWWASVVSQWELDPHHVHILTMACEAKDRAEAAREQVEREGMLINGLHGRRSHPLLSIERDCRLTFAKLLKQLNLDESDDNDKPGRGRR